MVKVQGEQGETGDPGIVGEAPETPAVPSGANCQSLSAPDPPTVVGAAK